MKEVKIQIPKNCELIKDGDTYIVREKKQEPPRSWEEFCRRFPVTKSDWWIKAPGYVDNAESNFITRNNKTWCTSREEAEAFLALMQLRQLRKAWVGDWEQTKGNSCAGIFYSIYEDKITVAYDIFWCNITLSFPTQTMACDFLNCFRGLCETAKILL